MTSSANNQPVAIIGMACRFPGGVSDVESFRQMLAEGRSVVGEIPHDRIDVEHFFDRRPATPGRMTTRWGGYLDGIQDFDAGFFGISPREAERLDPQQRLLLEAAWEAIEDAGLDAAKLEGSRTGVFVGQWTSDFEGRLFSDPEDVDFQMTTGSGRYAASGRISYFLGLRGPSLTIDTACSSSLVAIHMAVRSIQTGDSTLAFAGGVNVILQPHVSIAYSQSRMMAPDGRCKFGDASGDGYVRSEGAGVVLLKALDQAVVDGDRIYAIIRGGAINNDGRSSGSMGTPSQVGQEELLRTAYAAAGVSPQSVGYVEAHGTGTRAGDPVELGAITKVLGGERADKQPLLVGSVKTNIGHTEGAAGAAGFMKAVLAVQAGRIPASLNLKTRNPDINWESVIVPTSETPWLSESGPRVAGVSAFGIAGSNAHIVVEQPPVNGTATEAASRSAYLLPLSAKGPEALRELASRYADVLGGDPNSLPSVSWNAAFRRTALDERAVFVASDATAMAIALRDFAAGAPAAAEGSAVSGSPKVAFVFPGQGGQWVGMARQLLAEDQVFRATLERCDAAARSYIDWSIIGQLQASPESPDYMLERIDVIQPVLVAVSIAYAERLRVAGIKPGAVIGHSMGEVAAAYIAGVIDLDRALQIICRRSRLMLAAAGKGAMALIDLSAADTRVRLAGREAQATVAVVNSPRSCVISGEPNVIQDVVNELSAEGVFCRLVKVDVASHSHQMDAPAANLTAELAGLTAAAATVSIYSTVLAREVEGAEFDAAYWGANLRRSVQFSDAISRMIADGVSIFVECGPHPVLLPSIQQTAKAGGSVDVVTISTGVRDAPDVNSLLECVGGLWAKGVALDWQSIASPAPFVRLPLYPWQRERHWIAAADLVRGGARQTATRKTETRNDGKAAALEDSVYVTGWVDAPDVRRATPRHWHLLSDRGGIAQELAKLMTAAGLHCRVVDKLEDQVAGTGIVDLRGLDNPELEEGVYSLLDLVRNAAPESNVWAVTRNAQAVDPGERSSINIVSAAMWGLSAALSAEHGDVWRGCMDIDSSVSVSSAAKAILDHLLAGQPGDTALRGSRRLQARLRPMPKDVAASPVKLRADTSYVVTGGLGAVGFAIAQWMVEQGARRLVVLGRTPLPERRDWRNSSSSAVAAVKRLEAMGATVSYHAVDVGDEAALSAFIASYNAEDWPAIRGVVHAAGIADERLTGEMDCDATAAVLRGKARGALNLDRLLPDLDFMILTSSTAAVMPYPGQSAYAAANSVLDALAARRQGSGKRTLSIGWPTWIGLGIMGGAKGADRFRQLQLHGIGGIESTDASALLSRLVVAEASHVIVYPADWDVFRSTHSGRDLALFSELMPASVEAAKSIAQIADPLERRRSIDEGVRDAISRVLKMPVGRIDPRKPLGSMGLTSLLAMELRNRLEALVERPLSATLAFNYPNVEALVAFLADDSAPVVTAKPAQAINVSLGALAALSDQDAAQLLRRGR